MSPFTQTVWARLHAQSGLRLVAIVEAAAPFVAGALVTYSGLAGLSPWAGWNWPGPLQGTPATVGLLATGAGAAVMLAAWECRLARRSVEKIRVQLSRAQAQRDQALLQARRLRIQADGLALMREIHRSTAIPQRTERLHRILTLLAELLEAREVSLFAATTPQIAPAAFLRVTAREELFVCFDPSQPGSSTPKPLAGSLRVAAASSAIVREGCQLTVEALLECGGAPVAKAVWRPGSASVEDSLRAQDCAELVAAAVAKIDCSANAYAFLAHALKARRSVRMELMPGPTTRISSPLLTVCVPLVAEQRAIGVLRILRPLEGFDGAEAEALEEVLCESAKHIALALKKDRDDRDAITDSLTGMYIKRHFWATLESLRADNEAPTPFSLLMVDIDHFKKVNDRYGHLSGDLVLKGVAQTLCTGLRTGDRAFRYGGEEMALVLPNTSLEVAQTTAERLRRAVETKAFHGEAGQTIPVTISIGVACSQPTLTDPMLIGRADRALYVSKESGRNRVTVWRPDLDPKPELLPVTG